jgi:HEAT repeat protein
VADEENRLVIPDVADRIQTLYNLLNSIRSPNPEKQLEATTRLRKLVSVEKNPPFQDVIDTGVVPRLVEFLSFNNQPQLQLEACWALTNIASGSSNQTRYIIETGAVPLFKQLLLSPNEDVREQAIWALGNIAGDSPSCRDFILTLGVMEPLLRNIAESSHIMSLLRHATWTLSNLCRGKPQPSWGVVSVALPTLSKLIYSTDEEVLTDACWALSYLSDGPNERIQAILEANVAQRIVELLLHASHSVQTPALRMIGNIVTGDDEQTQIIINAKVLPCLLTLLSSPRRTLRKEACWTISNITAGNRNQVQAVVDAHIIPSLVEILNNADFDIKKEAAWAISNATSCGSFEQIRYLVSCHVIEPMCNLLTSADSKLVLVGLEALENILKAGEKEQYNQFATIIEECHGLDKLEHLQNHLNIEVYEKTINILETYFAAEDEEETVTPTNFTFTPSIAEEFNF